jgi:hypothetical protein
MRLAIATAMNMLPAVFALPRGTSQEEDVEQVGEWGGDLWIGTTADYDI